MYTYNILTSESCEKPSWKYAINFLAFKLASRHFLLSYNIRKAYEKFGFAFYFKKITVSLIVKNLFSKILKDSIQKQMDRSFACSFTRKTFGVLTFQDNLSGIGVRRRWPIT